MVVLRRRPERIPLPPRLADTPPARLPARGGGVHRPPRPPGARAGPFAPTSGTERDAHWRHVLLPRPAGLFDFGRPGHPDTVPRTAPPPRLERRVLGRAGAVLARHRP